jgi:hypothetical protein
MEICKEKRVVLVYDGYTTRREERLVVASEIEGCVKASRSLCIAFYFEDAEYVEVNGQRFYGNVQREKETFYFKSKFVTLEQLEENEESSIHYQRLTKKAREHKWKNMLYCERGTCVCLVEYVVGETIPVNEDGTSIKIVA